MAPKFPPPSDYERGSRAEVGSLGQPIRASRSTPIRPPDGFRWHKPTRGGGAPRAPHRADHRGAPARAGVGGGRARPSRSARWESQRTGWDHLGCAPTALVAVLRRWLLLGTSFIGSQTSCPFLIPNVQLDISVRQVRCPEWFSIVPGRCGDWLQPPPRFQISRATSNGLQIGRGSETRRCACAASGWASPRPPIATKTGTSTAAASAATAAPGNAAANAMNV
jgi:hypothetical protein